MYLDGIVGSLRDEAIGVVVTHANLMAELLFDGHPRRKTFGVIKATFLDSVHFVCSAEDEEPYCGGGKIVT